PDDHFHVLREGRRALRATASVARHALDKAVGEERRGGRRRGGGGGRQGEGGAGAGARDWRGRAGGGSRRGGGGGGGRARRRAAERAFDAWGREERIWQQVAAAFTLFGPTGELPTRSQAEAVVAAALPALPGPRWAKVRRLLSRPQLWTYLDRAREQLAALPVAESLRNAAV